MNDRFCGWPVTDDALLGELTAALASTAAKFDREGVFPQENLKLLDRHALSGLCVGAEVGGPGAGLREALRVVRAVARGEPATALVLCMQYLTTRALSRPDCRWPRHLRRRVLRSALEEGAYANNLRVEPELGSPARGGLPATVARREGGEWILSGHKLYTTGIDGLRWLIIWARDDATPPRVGQFLVPRDAPGIEVLRSWNHLGMRATASDEIVLREVRIPVDHAVDLRPPEEWHAAPDPDQAAWMNVLIAGLYDGIARNAEEWLLSFLRSRAPSSLGAPLATVPRVQESVGEIGLLLLESEVMLQRASECVDCGTPWSVANSALLKVKVTRNAIAVTELALKLSGNHGLSRESPLERFHRDVLCGRVHTPQEDTALVAAGRSRLLAPSV